MFSFIFYYVLYLKSQSCFHFVKIICTYTFLTTVFSLEWVAEKGALFCYDRGFPRASFDARNDSIHNNRTAAVSLLRFYSVIFEMTLFVIVVLPSYASKF